MLDDRAERQRREEGEAAHDQDDADHEADEQRAVGRKGAGRGRNDLLGRQRTRDGDHRHDHQEAADEHREADGRVVEERVRTDPGERRAVVAGRRRIGIEDLAEAVRAGVGGTGQAGIDHGGDGAEAKDRQRQDQDGEQRHLHFLGLDLLAEILRRAADHEAGDEHRDDGEHQHAVEARTDAADDDLAQLDVEHRDEPAERREAVEHAVDRTARGGRRDHGEQRGLGDAEAHLLALHVAAGLQARRRLRVDAECGDAGIAVGFGGVDRERAAQPQHAHHRQDRPALALVADHAAEHVGERRADREDQHHLHEVGERVGILERMRGIGVEEAAAVGAQHLDDFLRGDRTLGDHLPGAFQRRRLGIGAEILRHALPDEEQA